MAEHLAEQMEETPVTDESAARNKAVVAGLFDIIYGTVDDIDQLDDLVAEDYIQHHPLADQGREGLRAFLYKIVPEPKMLNPANILHVNLIADGDYVVRQELRTEGMLVDIFRMKDGLCQEHWDAYRPHEGTQRFPGF